MCCPDYPSARDVVVTPLRGPNATCNWQCSRPCRLHHGTCIWWFCLLAAICSFGGCAYWPLFAERADVLHRIVHRSRLVSGVHNNACFGKNTRYSALPEFPPVHIYKTLSAHCERRVGSAHALPTASYVAVGHVAYSVDLRDPDAYPGELLRVPASGGCSPPLVPALGCAWDLVEVPRSGGGILRQVRLRAKGRVRHSLLNLGP